MRSERWLFAILFFAGTLALGLMLVLQYAKHMPPCPLCVVQRYAYLCISLWAALGWTSLSCRPAMRCKLVPFFWLGILVTTLTGMIAAARQWWVVKQHATSLHCSFDTLEPIMNKLLPATLFPSVFKAMSPCENLDFSLLGLTLPTWSFLTLCAILFCTVYRMRAKVFFGVFDV